MLNHVVTWLSGGILDGIPADIVQPHDRLLKVAANVEANEQVKAWYAAKAQK